MDSDKRNGYIIGESPSHNHANDASGVKAKKLKVNIQKHGSKCNNPPSLVLGKVLSAAASPVIARLPKVDSLTRSVQRSRENDDIIVPKSCKDLIRPDGLCVTEKGTNLLFYDSGQKKRRILIFTSTENLQYLPDYVQWAADGTFGSAPSIFHQLCSIHGYKNDKMLPLVYMLLPSKSNDIYDEAFTVLKDRAPALKPERIMLDFECAAQNAFRSVFPDVELSGCLFHFGQSLWRQIQSIGLQARYNRDIRFALNVRMLLALSCVPVDDVCSAFNHLVDCQYYKENEDELRELLNYFERTWVGVLSRSVKKRLKSYFALRLWNVYDAIVNDSIRTNNDVEAWHSSLKKKVRVNHRSFEQFIAFMKNEQAKMEVLINQADTGLGINKKRKRVYVDIDYRLKNIAIAYDAKKMLKYLQ